MDVVTLGAALSIMKKMPDTAASSAAAAEAAQAAAEAAAEQAEGAIEVDDTLSVKGRAADAKATGDKFDKINEALYTIREPGENLGYITNFSGKKTTVGVTCEYISPTQLKVYGTAGSWVRMNLLRGNSQIIAGIPTFDNNLSAGTYTLKADTDVISVFYGADWDSRTSWESGESITIESPVTVWLGAKTPSYSFGTEENPTIFNFELYRGNVSAVPTAVDTVARASIETTNEKIGEVSFNKRIAHTDFDYTRPYNIFNGTTFTADKKVNYQDGTLSDEAGRLATDYIEIDSTKEYLCLNIYVYLMYETGEGLSTGGNRCWVNSNWAFYDENKTFISPLSNANDSSKKIPSNAKYVRLTLDKASMIPYAVLFYGNYSTQQWVKYTDYRKEITEDSVYSATGMEKLNMVMFGDSITHGAPSHNGGLGYVDYANDYLRSNIINVGLGGTRMSQGSPAGIGLGSFASLCENIVSEDANVWDDLDALVEDSHQDWATHVATLKSINWSNVHAIGLLYGANDWHNNVPVGSGYNEDTSNYDGACAYGLKTLLTKYPHLQVLIFTPFYREASGSGSDTANGAGLTMNDYGKSLKNVQEVFHCPIVDSGNELNINRYTLFSYTSQSDATHPRKLLGLQRIGRFVAEAVKRYIQPF